MRILAMIDGTFAQSAVRTAIAGTALLNYPVVAEMLLRATEQDLGRRKPLNRAVLHRAAVCR
jgi:hypothetical protein